MREIIFGLLIETGAYLVIAALAGGIVGYGLGRLILWVIW